MIADRTRLRTEMHNAAILISDLEIEDARRMVRVLEIVHQADHRALMIVARKVSDGAMAVLLTASREPEKFRGVSLLACRPALCQRLDHGTDSDERAAYRILLKAMETPIRTLLTNAGYDASEVMPT